ncbi:hypothetical protein EYM_01035 [Ignicoccus islandicus DSM 13165]|uniref:Glutamine amidotransferase type-2 domain-containing protein n=1 Tax=Ignicoccus islandicus DSM 13165 TaxID=940295 RepID=A0A0U3E2M6_9CREN|nr:hypothetical protein [Ignicoccus islandicus]ALU12171.1 hypothetical protein EYM_01035 [Ignicoccus islandicus DSM 13165]
MCRLLGGLGKPRYLSEFVKIARRDSKGKPNPDGWGYAVIDSRGQLRVFKTLYPIWERPTRLPEGIAFLVHARRAEKLGRSIDHLQPHVCNGVVMAHNGGVALPLEAIKDLNLAFRSSSERLACFLGNLVSRLGTERAVNILSKRIKPTPSANFIALVPSEMKFVVYNHHLGDPYHVIWRKGNVFSSEPLGPDWKPMSSNGEPRWEVLSLR